MRTRSEYYHFRTIRAKWEAAAQEPSEMNGSPVTMPGAFTSPRNENVPPRQVINTAQKNKRLSSMSTISNLTSPLHAISDKIFTKRKSSQMDSRKVFTSSASTSVEDGPKFTSFTSQTLLPRPVESPSTRQYPKRKDSLANPLKPIPPGLPRSYTTNNLSLFPVHPAVAPLGPTVKPLNKGSRIPTPVKRQQQDSKLALIGGRNSAAAQKAKLQRSTTQPNLTGNSSMFLPPLVSPKPIPSHGPPANQQRWAPQIATKNAENEPPATDWFLMYLDTALGGDAQSPYQGEAMLGRYHKAEPRLETPHTQAQSGAKDNTGMPVTALRIEKKKKTNALKEMMTVDIRRASVYDVTQHQLMRAVSPNTPSTSLTSGGPVGWLSGKVKAINSSSGMFRASNTELSPCSERSERRKNHFNSPASARLIREVTLAQPMAYWSGRFQSLSDRFLWERFESQLGMNPRETELTPEEHKTTEEGRAKRAFKELEKFCVTDEALESLKDFQAKFAREKRMLDLLPPQKPIRMSMKPVIKKQDMSASHDSDGSWEFSTKAIDHKPSFMDKLMGKSRKGS